MITLKYLKELEATVGRNCEILVRPSGGNEIEIVVSTYYRNTVPDNHHVAERFSNTQDLYKHLEKFKEYSKGILDDFWLRYGK